MGSTGGGDSWNRGQGQEKCSEPAGTLTAHLPSQLVFLSGKEQVRSNPNLLVPTPTLHTIPFKHCICTGQGKNNSQITLMHKDFPLLPNHLNLSLLPKAGTRLQCQESPYELKQWGIFLICECKLGKIKESIQRRAGWSQEQALSSGSTLTAHTPTNNRHHKKWSTSPSAGLYSPGLYCLQFLQQESCLSSTPAFKMKHSLWDINRSNYRMLDSILGSGNMLASKQHPCPMELVFKELRGHRALIF